MISKRDSFERELIQLINEINPKIYGQRGTHSDGADVLLHLGHPGAKCSECFHCEVKTSNSPVRYFGSKTIAQYNNYMNTLKEYNILTYYCFRTLSKKKTLTKKNRKGEVTEKIKFVNGDLSTKWRIYRVDELPLNNRGTPYLDIFVKDGMMINEFVKLINGRK